MRLLLASTSMARRRMLEAAGVPFEAVSARLDEETEKARLRAGGAGASALAQGLADAKAASVAAAGALVLGSDQVLEREDGSTQDKPGSREEAEAQLHALAGRTHRLHSAAAVAEDGEIVWRAAETVSLTMRRFSDAFLSTYLNAEYDVVRHGVGGYRIEGPGVQLFDRIEGSHFAILGLPLLPLLGFLRARGIVAR